MNKYEFIESLRDCSQTCCSESNSGSINKIAYLKDIINNETRNSYIDSVTLNVAVRSYYHIVETFQLNDKDFDEIFVRNKKCDVIDARDYLILHSRLLNDQWRNLDIEWITNNCLNDFVKAMQQHHPALLIILKSLNLLHKKHLTDRLPTITLDDVYFGLQTNESDMRQQLLILFDIICSSKMLAKEYFQSTISYLPWTNKNKYYILGSILNNYSLTELFSLTGQYSCNDDLNRFLDGLRFSLNCESLLVPSSFLFKAMSVSSSNSVLHLSLGIFTNGTIKEMQNFLIYWFPSLQQKHIFFETLEDSLNLHDFMERPDLTNLFKDMFSIRLIFICNMFSKEVLQSKFYNRFITNIMENCFRYDLQIQYQIFRFVVKNFLHLSFVESLEFLYLYLERHKRNVCAKIRSDILNKIPTIINYIRNFYSKIHKLHKDEINIYEVHIVKFFKNLQILIEENIRKNCEYQERIFALKLLEHILKSLNLINSTSQQPKNLQKNQNGLDLFVLIKSNNLFNSASIWLQLFDALNNSTDFNDTRHLTIHLMNSMKPEIPNSSIIRKYEEFCKDSNIDNCLLAPIFARLVIQRLNEEENSVEENIPNILDGILTALTAGLEAISKDAFAACKLHGNHLFGYLGILNVLAEYQMAFIEYRLDDILHIMEQIINGILQMLNLTSNQEFANVYCLSFQHIHESLDVLIENSQHAYENRSEAITYLLLSFWLTLKAGCELAATIGCHVIDRNTQMLTDFNYFQSCFRLIESILIKCRHKGAIEAAAQCLGKLIKSISTATAKGIITIDSPTYKLINDSMEHLFAVDGKYVSTTRRGAGFAKMFLHIIRNECPQTKRPILGRSLHNLLEILRKIPHNMNGGNAVCKENYKANFDHINALALHYLCFLIQDAELNNAMRHYYGEILMIVLNLIDHPEWTICNAAVQLFAALTCKIVGQRQAVKLKDSYSWQSTDITFMEILRKFPKAFAYMLNYISSKQASTRAIILFLEFLHKIENSHDYCEKEEQQKCWNVKDVELLQYSRYIMWCLLSHNCAKVRRLAAICFVRLHRFADELPEILYEISEMIAVIKNVNFLDGLLNTLYEGILKMRCETQFIVAASYIDGLEEIIRENLKRNLVIINNKQSYLNCKIIDLMILLNFDMKDIQLITSTLSIKADVFGNELWLKYTNHVAKDCNPHIEAFDLVETINNTVTDNI